MPLPETIPVKYTEEEAEYLSVRPLVRQTFRLAELVDMVVSVAGKNADRLQQILRSGTIVFHSYRYWWAGFETGQEELRALLAGFPDADPARPFRAEDCTVVLFAWDSAPARRAIELRREAAAAKRFFHSRSFWDCLMELAATQAPVYAEYSYSRRSDMYKRELTLDEMAALKREAEQLAPRALREQLKPLPEVTRVIFMCPRRNE